jgi:trehalose 6-phosphate phosphatase
MAYLFSDSGRARLAEVITTEVMCIFDFDGTLVPIMSQPDKVHLQPPMLQRLSALQQLAPVAIVTGRAVADARQR